MTPGEASWLSNSKILLPSFLKLQTKLLKQREKVRITKIP